MKIEKSEKRNEKRKISKKKETKILKFEKRNENRKILKNK